MPDVYIGVGSNHNAAANMRKGIHQLREKVRILRLSPVYESRAEETADAPNYWNAAVAIETALAPAALKAVLVQIEDACGRVRRDADGQKSKIVALDFDILLYEDRTISYDYDGKSYALPHPDIVKYAHTTVPLADITPDRVHPTSGQTIAVLASRLGDAAALKRLDNIVIA